MPRRSGKRWIVGVALTGLALPMATVDAAQAREARVAQSTQADAEAAYRRAREALNRGEYERAAALFDSYRSTYQDAPYVADAHYWQAFALYRLGSLRESLRLLDSQLREDSTGDLARDVQELHLRIQSILAQEGDADAAEGARRQVERALLEESRIERARREEARYEDAARTEELRAIGGGRRSVQEACEDDDVREAAVSALMQMDASRAVPVLQRVLARRDACSVPLRKQAVFVLAQHGGAEVEETMLDVARNDPEPDVQEAAVFWLSQVGTERAVDALADILATSDEPRIQDKAVFALSQHSSDRAGQILQEYAVDSSKPEHIREKAIFWLSQHPSHVDSRFLIELYESLESRNLKEKVFFSLSQRPDSEAIAWMLDRARDRSEEVEVRKKALFWAMQGGADLSALDGLYESLPDREMKEQVIFLYSQRPGPAAVDRLIEIARTEEDAELRKKAIFWLGQTGDERAAQFLLELLEEEPR